MSTLLPSRLNGDGPRRDPVQQAAPSAERRRRHDRLRRPLPPGTRLDVRHFPWLVRSTAGAGACASGRRSWGASSSGRTGPRSARSGSVGGERVATQPFRPPFDRVRAAVSVETDDVAIAPAGSCGCDPSAISSRPGRSSSKRQGELLDDRSLPAPRRGSPGRTWRRLDEYLGRADSRGRIHQLDE
jgi:hypothetical protein